MTIPEEDKINYPAHYTSGKIESIEAIESSVGKEGFEAYCTGNAIKYLWRWKHKGGVEDLKKAEWYLKKLISKQER
ncbi:MAG: DUF3310 domain-containing protein [Christensenellaceae bacterium]